MKEREKDKITEEHKIKKLEKNEKNKITEEHKIKKLEKNEKNKITEEHKIQNLEKNEISKLAEEYQINKLFDLNETIATKIFDGIKYPWEALPKIEKFILELGNTLSLDEYDKIGDDVWIEKSATVAPTAYIKGPAIIGKDAEIRHCAFIRGKAIVGEGAVVGNSTELKNVILFNKVQVPHYNYIGDSILGYKAHMGAGSITSNVRSDKKLVTVKFENDICKIENKKLKNIELKNKTEELIIVKNENANEKTKKESIKIETGLRKFGAILGDNVEIGCGSVLNPGTIIGKNTIVYPLSSVRRVVPANSIYKNQNEIVERG